MKTTILTFLLVISSFVFSQNVPNMDTIESVLLSSSYHSIDKPFLSSFKKHQDVGFIMNIKDEKLYIFHNGKYESSGKIDTITLDNTGHMHVLFTLTHQTNIGTTNIAGVVCYTIGSDYMTMVMDGKITKHTKLFYEFEKNQSFNIDN